MKRFSIIALAFLLTLSLFACAKQESVRTVSKRGTDYLVDTEQKTISDGEHTYQYAYSEAPSATYITITYPNGSTYWYSGSDGTGQFGWSDYYDENAYADGDALVEVVEEVAPKRANPGKVVAAIVLAALGILNTVFPEVVWYLGYGWRYKDAEPSDAALAVNRIGGVAVIILGIVLLFS